MPRLFVSNFDFEHQLGPRPRTGANEPIERINRELAAVWVAIADDGDFVWMPGKADPEFFGRLVESGLPAVHPVNDVSEVPNDVKVCPWGWSPTFRDWAESNGWEINAPPANIVAEANSREFSATLERGMEIPGAVTVTSRTEFLTAIAALPPGQEDWVVKATFSMSAAERILGRGRAAEASAMNWVEKRLKIDGVVFFEPWVERIEEVGLQFTVPREGSPQFEGCTPLLTHPTGQYRGSRFAPDTEIECEWQTPIDVGFRAAGALQGRGYFGPLGIDATRYRDSAGQERVRPLQDINARYTMGRLALGFRRLLKTGEHGSWLHVRWPHDTANAPNRWFDELRRALPADVRAVPTTPFTINGEPTHFGSLVVIARNAATLQVTEELVFSQEG